MKRRKRRKKSERMKIITGIVKERGKGRGKLEDVGREKKRRIIEEDS